MLRALAFAAGLTGAVAGSQFPEFSQQYVQRLGGAVDALAEVVADFDASAAAAGLRRDEALAELRGSAFLDRRRQDMAQTFVRFERLRADLDALEAAGPWARAAQAHRFRDAQVVRATWDAYVPAVPISWPGITFAALGFALAWCIAWAAFRLLAWPFQRRAQS